MLHRVLPLLSIVFITTLVFAQYANQGSYGGLDPKGMRPVISGEVHDLKGNPISGAEIEITDVASGRVLADTYSSANGSFEVNGLATAQYELVATFGISEVRTHVDPGMTHNIGITISLGNDASNAVNSPAVSVSQLKVPGKAKKLFQKAMDAFHKARVDDALGFVQQALGLYPEYAKALTLRGVLNMQKGDTKDAEPDLQKAVELDYSDDLGFVALASLYNTQNKFDDALRILERGMTIHPTSWQGLMETARAQCGKLQFEDALKSLNKADKVLPSDVMYQHLYRAKAFIGLKNYPPAIAELETYLSRVTTGPNVESAEHTLGQLRQIVLLQAKQ